MDIHLLKSLEQELEHLCRRFKNNQGRKIDADFVLNHFVWCVKVIVKQQCCLAVPKEKKQDKNQSKKGFKEHKTNCKQSLKDMSAVPLK